MPTMPRNASSSHVNEILNTMSQQSSGSGSNPHVNLSNDDDFATTLASQQTQNENSSTIYAGMKNNTNTTNSNNKNVNLPSKGLSIVGVSTSSSQEQQEPIQKIRSTPQFQLVQLALNILNKGLPNDLAPLFDTRSFLETPYGTYEGRDGVVEWASRLDDMVFFLSPPKVTEFNEVEGGAFECKIVMDVRNRSTGKEAYNHEMVLNFTTNGLAGLFKSFSLDEREEHADTMEILAIPYHTETTELIVPKENLEALYAHFAETEGERAQIEGLKMLGMWQETFITQSHQPFVHLSVVGVFEDVQAAEKTSDQVRHMIGSCAHLLKELPQHPVQDSGAWFTSSQDFHDEVAVHVTKVQTRNGKQDALLESIQKAVEERDPIEGLVAYGVEWLFDNSGVVITAIYKNVEVMHANYSESQAMIAEYLEPYSKAVNQTFHYGDFSIF